MILTSIVIRMWAWKAEWISSNVFKDLNLNVFHEIKCNYRNVHFALEQLKVVFYTFCFFSLRVAKYLEFFFSNFLLSAILNVSVVSLVCKWILLSMFLAFNLTKIDAMNICTIPLKMKYIFTMAIAYQYRLYLTDKVIRMNKWLHWPSIFFLILKFTKKNDFID